MKNTAHSARQFAFCCVTTVLTGAACGAVVPESGKAAVFAASGAYAPAARAAARDRRREFLLPENGRPRAFRRKTGTAHGGSPDRAACPRALRARRVSGTRQLPLRCC